MSHPSYPLFLSVSGVPVLVIGAGRVAERKISGLLQCGANVTVVAPQATRAIHAWARAGRLRWHERPYHSGDLRSHRMLFCATDHADVDERAAREAGRRGLLVNCASRPEFGNITVPASARAGRVQIAVSTDGASPVLAQRLARQFSRESGSMTAKWASLLHALRPTILDQVPRTRRHKLLQELAGNKVGRLIHDGSTTEARRLALALIQKAAGKPLKK